MGSVEKVDAHGLGDRDEGWLSLLANNQYEQVTNCVEEAYSRAAADGDTEQAALLAAARQLCASCQEIQKELSFHRQAYQNTEVRREKLDAELQKLLQMVKVSLEAAVSSPERHSTRPTREKERPNLQELASNSTVSLWQRIQQFLGWPAKTESLQEPDLKMADSSEDEVPQLLSVPPEDQTDVVLSTLESTVLPEATPTEISEPKLAEISDIKMSRVEPPPLIFEQNFNPPDLIVYCLGAFRVYDKSNRLVDWNGLKGQSIFKFLVTRPRKPVTKDLLMELFWPDGDPDAARRNLHQAIYSLRKTLKKIHSDIQSIIFEKDCYLLNPDLEIWLDYKEFEKHLEIGRRLEKDGAITQAMAEYGIAEGLYQGNFLSEDLYEDWTRDKREQLRQSYVEITNRLSEQYLLQKEYTAAVAMCQKLLAQDSCHEGAHRRLIICYRGQNQRHLAIRQYYRCREILDAELDISPSEKTEALFRKLISQ